MQGGDGVFCDVRRVERVFCDRMRVGRHALCMLVCRHTPPAPPLLMTSPTLVSLLAACMPPKNAPPCHGPPPLTLSSPLPTGVDA